jgi:hypothetical protein
VLKDISPPRAAEPSIIATESVVEALKAQTNVYKERLVTGTYIGRNIKQVRKTSLIIWDSICNTIFHEKLFAGKENKNLFETSNIINLTL